jgi:hypothetical protein
MRGLTQSGKSIAQELRRTRTGKGEQGMEDKIEKLNGLIEMMEEIKRGLISVRAQLDLLEEYGDEVMKKLNDIKE